MQHHYFFQKTYPLYFFWASQAYRNKLKLRVFQDMKYHCVNPLVPNISIYILQTVNYTFPQYWRGDFV